MIQVRKTVMLKEGEAVDMLVTPHLAVYEDAAGVPKYVPEDAGTLRIMERYADLMYLAAINAWELDGHGTLEDFPHKRGDFHALMQADPNEFARTVKFFVQALSGKTEREMAAEEAKARQEAGKKAQEGEGEETGGVKKKKGLFSRLMSRRKRSS